MSSFAPRRHALSRSERRLYTAVKPHGGHASMPRQETPGNRARLLLAAGLIVWALVHRPGCQPLFAQPASPSYSERWVYAGFNLQVEKSADDLGALCERAAKAGYTGIVLSDYKLQILDRVPDYYFRNAERVKAAAARAGIEIIPAVFSIGYSNGHLAHDPNLAEGLPVLDQPYLVKEQSSARVPSRSGAAKRPTSSGSRSRVAVLDARVSQIPNGGLEETKGDRVAGFGLQDDPGVTTFVDREVRHSGRVSLRVEPGSKDARRSVPLTRLGARSRCGRIRPIASLAGSGLAIWARSARSTCLRSAPAATAASSHFTRAASSERRTGSSSRSSSTVWISARPTCMSACGRRAPAHTGSMI